MAFAPRFCCILGVGGLLFCLATVSASADLAPPKKRKAERIGNWRFKLPERPIKAVVFGGSTTAYPNGNYGQFIEAACPRVEVVNKGKAAIGMKTLRERFVKQVLRNRRLGDLAQYKEFWIIIRGGLNRVGTPYSVNDLMRGILKRAHDAGVKTLALSLGPWGSTGVRRFNWVKGLKLHHQTKHTVDFVMGRLNPKQALGRLAQHETWQPGELPDIAVDLWDSELRDTEAPLRNERYALDFAKRDPWIRKQVRALPESERAAAVDTWARRLREVPRWFMKKELRGFDHFHPNQQGHRTIAKVACPHLPTSWGCDCAAIPTMRYERKTRQVMPRVNQAVSPK